MSAEISVYSRNEQNLHEVMRQLGAGRILALQSLLKKSGDANSIKEVADTVENLFKVYRGQFDRSDIDSLRSLQQIFLKIKQPKVLLTRNRAARDNQIARIKQIVRQIDSLVNEIKLKFPLPAPIRDLILEYAEDYVRKGLDLPPLAMDKKRVRSLEKSQVKALGEKYGEIDNLTFKDYQELTQFFEHSSAEQRGQFFCGYFKGENSFVDDDSGLFLHIRKSKAYVIAKLLPKNLKTIDLTGITNPSSLITFEAIIRKCSQVKICHLSQCVMPGLLQNIANLKLRNVEEFSLKDCSWECSEIDEKRYFETLLFDNWLQLKKLDLRGTPLFPETVQLLQNSKPLHNVQILIEPEDAYKEEQEEKNIEEID